VVEIIKDFIQAQSIEGAKTNTFAQWLITTFGEKFAKTFPMQYAVKFHTTRAENLSTDWLENRFYQPKLEEILQGALSPKTPQVHYIDHFRYPSKNGFVSYFNLFLNKAELKLGHELVTLNPKTRQLHFVNDFRTYYDYLISSIPLPELIPMITDVPEDVLAASRRLACSTCVVVNVGIDRENIFDNHWAYFYDQDIIFSRLSFPHMFSSNNVPPGAGSIQAEVYFSKKYKPTKMEPDSYIQPVLNDLLRCGILREDDKILFKKAWASPYANVIFDLERAKNLAIVHGYLDEIGIPYCGRYGEWKYIWTDESFMSGENAAQNILNRIF
jgi:protoporphyrinogen oxidase